MDRFARGRDDDLWGVAGDPAKERVLGDRWVVA